MKVKEETEKDAVSVQNTVNIHMPDILREKIRGWVDACDTECGGLGTTMQDDDGNIIVDNVFIFKQIASGGYFRLCNKDRSVFDTKLIKGESEIIEKYLPSFLKNSEKYDDDVSNLTEEELLDVRSEIGRSIYGRMNFHWHSHVDMPAFWSSTDCSAADSMLEQYSWAVMMVSNKYGNSMVKYIQRKPRITIDNIKLKVIKNYKDLRKKCKEEVDELVKSMATHRYDEEEDMVVKDNFSRENYFESNPIVREFGTGTNNILKNRFRSSLPDDEDTKDCPKCKNKFSVSDGYNCPDCGMHILKDFCPI